MHKVKYVMVPLTEVNCFVDHFTELRFFPI